jgi:hypothetical protein
MNQHVFIFPSVNFFVGSFFLLDTIMLPWTEKSIFGKFSLIFVTFQSIFSPKS